ncbi:hypothetical protein [Streptomyces collinus]
MTSYAAKIDDSSAVIDGEDPQWQSDNSLLPSSYNPYLVSGKDVSAEPVAPLVEAKASGSCDTIRVPVSSKIKYTVVGEAHAGWDAKASFEYESSMSSSIETAVKSNGNWNLGGSKELSQNVSISVGYPNRGPHYAKQYKIPIEYTKIKSQYICFGGVRSTWYTIEPKRYKAPTGGALGKVGKDVSSKDGSAAFKRSKKAYRNYLNPGDAAQQNRGKSVKFGGAVSFYASPWERRPATTPITSKGSSPGPRRASTGSGGGMDRSAPAEPASSTRSRRRVSPIVFAAVAVALTLVGGAVWRCTPDSVAHGYRVGTALADEADMEVTSPHAQVGKDYWVALPAADNLTGRPLTLLKGEFTHIPHDLKLVEYRAFSHEDTQGHPMGTSPVGGSPGIPDLTRLHDYSGRPSRVAPHQPGEIFWAARLRVTGKVTSVLTGCRYIYRQESTEYQQDPSCVTKIRLGSPLKIRN